MSYISDEMNAALGTRLSRKVSFPVSESDIRRWAIAVMWPEPPPPLLWDATYAKTTPHGGIVAPEEFNPFAWMCAESESHDTTVTPDPNDPNHLELALGIPSPGLQFQLNGGISVEYGVRMHPGDVITSESFLASYSEREGRLGLMLFTVMEDVWTNQNSDVVKRSETTLIRY